MQSTEFIFYKTLTKLATIACSTERNIKRKKQSNSDRGRADGASPSNLNILPNVNEEMKSIEDF